MEGRSSFGRDRDRDRDRGRDRDRPVSLPEHPTSPNPQFASQLDHGTVPHVSQGSQISQTPSRAPHLPSLPESPLTPARMSESATFPLPSVSSQTTVINTNTSTAPSDTTPPASVPTMQPTIRAVTPELLDHSTIVTQDLLDAATAYSGISSSTVPPLPPRVFGSMSPQGSPRALSHHGSTTSRRQGVVFSDTMASPFDSTISESSPPSRPAVLRPRTYTMDGVSLFREPLVSSTSPESRNRVGSFSSSGTVDSTFRSTSSLQGPPLESLLSYPHIAATRSSETQPTPTSAPFGGITASSSAGSVSSIGGTGFVSSTPSATSSRDKKSSSRRLIKRSTSRPTSPLISPPPSVDSLPLPIPTDNANKVLMLMKNLCGRMRGEIEYRNLGEESWHHGMSYIEEEKGSLMFDAGDHGPFHMALVADLRGCRVVPAVRPDKDGRCLELANAQATTEIVFRPLVATEFDLWLAALLCWQQLRLSPGVVAAPPATSKPPNSRSASSSTIDSGKRRASAAKVKEGAIIKVGKVMLWDKGAATSPRAIVKRPSTRDLRSVQTSWRRVSCILQGNGEFKLMTENDVTILSVIELAQLSRCAIQQLDKSVLDDDYCIAIFPIYAPTSTHLSIFRPVYIALDSRVAFEVWFVLLRAFAVPDVYVLDRSKDNQVYSITDMQTEREEAVEDDSAPPTPDEKFVELGEKGSSETPVRTRQRQLFRLEKTLNLRVTEAKIKPRILPDGSPVPVLPQERTHERHHGKLAMNNDPEQLIGNYLAEVILDGEVRARTTIKSDTKNPFWREDCEFGDLPSTLPYLSVVLKRVDGSLDSFTHQLQASLGLPKTGNLLEYNYGAVDISLADMDKGKDYEHWLPVIDDRQQTVGTMLIKVHHEELAVLSAKEYKPVLDMLQKFSSGLTLQIAEVMPGSLRRLSEVFLNIFQVSGTAADWLMALVEDEIDGIGNQTTMKKMRFSRRLRSNESMESSSDREQMVRDMGRSLQGEANLLFRGNSLLTQALEFHMRRLGKEYLEEILSEKIFEINEVNPDCEVDPSKVSNHEDIHKHWELLMGFTYEIWECITVSAARFPSELRHILKYIRAVAEDRYGDFLRTVAYTSVSGFLFLRFICPAILNPKLFGLLRDHPRPQAQRTLTLIAKGLQALANLSTIGKKETWMEPMNRFLAGQRQSVKDFIDAVCSIPAEKPNAAPILPASYSTPIAIMGRLPPAAREGFPSLPYLIDQPHYIAALVKMWMDAHPLSAPTHVYDGDLLEFNGVCVELQARSDECLTRTVVLRQSTDTDSSHPKPEETLAESMEQASLADTVNLSYGNSSTWIENAEGVSVSSYSGHIGSRSGGLAPPGSSGSEVDDNWGRDHKERQVSSNNGNSNGKEQYDIGGSIKILRNGKQARKFFSGIINRKPRTASPEHVGAPGLDTRDNEFNKDGEQVREREVKDHEKGRERGREQDRELHEHEYHKIFHHHHKDKEREREKEKEKEKDKDKEKVKEKDKDTDKLTKRDRPTKSEKSSKSRHLDLGESWSPSAFGAPDLPPRQNKK
ncbi:RasGAP group protein [Sporothrix schenckii 1099-18]|uniref:RasGAP group protein n=1 Tax=Sporothrix schenckii 1099-18 TaxID=1397361 RepID=A0A0F2M8N2_SPOSC|nr:RasGAP group protein [Sporothrix schenckii 1099-18]KJR84526.1 RasGAP group protein [Sporothrix schenckii 1099-18]